MSCKGFKILSLMQRWGSKREMMGDDPPYLAVGTEVSAKYKGAFCEAKVRKIVRSVKCKIAFKLGLGSATVTDDQIKGTLRAGSVVEVKHPDKKELVEATIIKIQDCSQYTVVFDDGDITTLRRTALCLKSGRHFAESETLDQLPLTHPEHFGNPVIGGRRGRRNRQDDSSDDDDSSKKGKQPKEEKEADIGKVVCVEISEKKKQKDNWFPGLVVAPTAQDTVKINVKEDYLVRSFKDGRYYTVPKKEATSFTREIGLKVDNNTLKIAVDKALLFLDRDELPPHWDRELLFGLNDGSDSDSDAAFDSDTSDDEPREEKDHFVAQLYKFMDDRGTPINKGPTINGRDVDLYKLFKVVHKLGGCNRVTNHNQWKTVSHKLGFGQNPTSVNLVKHAYKKFLHSFEDFYRKLGCTMVNHPRGQRARHRGGRSLIRDKDKALPTKDKIGEKDGEDSREELPVEPEKKEKDVLVKEEPKPKEPIAEPVLKVLRETRKEVPKPKSERVEKKEDIKVLPAVSKVIDLPTKSIAMKGDEKVKSDDREERIKMREMARADVISKDDSKPDKDNAKNVKDITKNEESQRIGKATRREVKESKKEEKEKEEDKSKVAVEREGRMKKNVTPVSVEPSSSTDENKTKKSRSLFSKMTGSKRPKEISDKVPRANKGQIGVQSVRQKRTFSERMKAMVKKLKLKTGGKHLRHKSPGAVESKDSGDKKKPSAEESPEPAVPQLTRSKSKEEMVLKTRKTETPVEKKTSVPSSQTNVPEKKPSSTKKKKDDDKATSTEEILDLLPNYKSVSVGDKLKVYYGPTHESKVTYEAKVLSLKEEDSDTVYLVHYTGWNTRYDEWIRRNRIADNLSWSPGRAKRTRQPPTSQGSHPPPHPRVGKRSKSRSGEVRSTTPSSVTSSSSRTKSPAVSGPGQRNVRSRQRTRRVSGHTHTDFSESEDEDNYESDDMENVQALVDQRLSKEIKEDKETKDSKELLMDRMRSRGSYRRRVESSCESEEPNSEQQESKNKKIKEETEEERTRSRSEKKKTDDANKLSSPVVDDSKKEVGTEVLRSDRLRNKRKLAEEKADSGDEKESKPELKMEEIKIQKVAGEDKRKSDVKPIGESDKSSPLSEVEGKRKLKRKSDETTVEEETKSSERRRSRRVTPRKEEMKIKDDGNQSEGQDVDQNKLESKVDVKEELDTPDIIEKDIKEEYCENEVGEEEKESDSNSKFDSVPEDIYEFKEPEPFEFEVRSKCGEEKGGKQRRTFGRMSEEPTSPASVRKKLTRMKSESPTSFENKRHVKKSLSKLEDEDKEKIDFALDVKEDVEVDSKTSPRPVSPKDKQKNQETSAKSKSVSKDGEGMFQPLSLFSDLPGEGAGEEDSNDRLVISEPETEGESQEPLFSHQQRDHEDFFPTSITQASSVDNSVSKSPFSGFAEKLKEDDEKEEEKVQPKKGKIEEEEDDPIMSAIQRVFAQSSNEDEDSNDIDLLTELPDPVNKKPNVISIDKTTDSNSESTKSIDSQTVENPDSQLSLSNNSEAEDNEVTITDEEEMKNEKIIEEINLASTDSEAEEVPEIEESGNDDEDNTTDIVEISDQPTKKEESLEDDDKTVEESKVVMEEYDENNSEVQENVAQVNDDSVSSNSSAEGKGERETASASCSTSEVDSEDNKEKQEGEGEEVEEEVELDEEVIIETVEEKRDSEEENNDEEPTIVEERAEEIVVEEAIEVDSKEEVVKEETAKEEVCEPEEGNLESLLCEETIPGSPAPSSSVAVENTLPSSPELPFASVPVTYKPPPPQAKLPPPPPPPPPPPAPAPVPPSPANEAAPVMENTPPTTPESSLSPISNSPRGERSGSSPVPENDSSKSNRDSSEVDMEAFPPTTKISNFSEEDTNSGAANTNSNLKKTSTTEENEAQSIRKRRRSHKRSDDNGKRIKLSHRSPRHNRSESDDDTSENSLDLMSLHSRSPRPSKYNFFVQLDPDLDVSQRIDVLQQKLTELRKTYMSVKAELAGIDRRRKKLRRRERDASVKANVKTEVACS